MWPHQELKLQRSGGTLRPQGGSSLEMFATRGGSAAYADMAAATMARVRARLTGYVDDGGSGEGPADTGSNLGAAALGIGSQEAVQEAGSGAGPAARRVLCALLHQCACREERAEAIAEACVPPGIVVDGDGGSAAMHVCTTPAGLQAAIAEELQALSTGPISGSQDTALLSGEALEEVLGALQEDIANYDRAVYSRLTPLERFGAGGGF